MNPPVKQIKTHARLGMVWFQNQWIAVKKMASDGCTGIPEFGLTHCCEQHDADYTIGSGVTRLRGDYKLMHCVGRKAKAAQIWSEKAFYYALAPLFFIGVRLLGWRRYHKVNNNNGN